MAVAFRVQKVNPIFILVLKATNHCQRARLGVLLKRQSDCCLKLMGCILGIRQEMITLLICAWGSLFHNFLYTEESAHLTPIQLVLGQSVSLCQNKLVDNILNSAGNFNENVILYIES